MHTTAAIICKKGFGALPVASFRHSENISKWMSEAYTALKSACRRRAINSFCGTRHFACIHLYLRLPAFYVVLE